MMLISVIVTTYNREDALEAVLRSLARQTDQDFEVIVADDGSKAPTAALVEAWKAKLGHRLDHVWHEDRGFRAAEIRNRAILASRGDYVVFLDGDCIARPDFVATHRRLAERGWFVTGNRILLSPELTAKVLRDKLAPENWRFADWLAQRLRGGINRLAALLRLPLGPLRRLRHRRLARRALLQSRGLALRSRPRRRLRRRLSAAGARRIPTSSCGCCMPALSARTACSRPACCTCGTRKPTAARCRRTSASSPTSSPAATSARSAACPRMQAAAPAAASAG